MEHVDVIKKPIVTEKTTMLSEQRKYTFEVDKNANKIQIKQAVEELFDVKVEKVNVINVKKKPKRVGQYEGYTKGVSKAVVTLAEGQSIDVYKA